MTSLLSILTNVAFLALITGCAFAQAPHYVKARQVSELGNVRADDEMAHLDLLAKELTESRDARGYVIGYSQENFPPGLFLRRLYGYRDYLVNSRGIEPGRIVIVEGGNRDRITTELWLVPEEASAPKPSSEFSFSFTKPLRFDTAYPDCPSEFSIYLEELDDHLRFYAEALRVNPNARSRIIVYPGQRGRSSKTAKMARDTRSMLTKKYNVSADRIVARVRSHRRECTEVELWIMPAGAAPARATPNNGMHPTRDTKVLMFYQRPQRAGDARR